ncbi:MAG: MFS transporter [Acidilobaceae archaeon]
MIELVERYRTLYLFVVSFAIIGGLSSSILAPYVRNAGFDAAHYGLFAASIAMGSLIGGFLGGFLSDFINPTKLVVLSALFSASGYVTISINGSESLVTAALLLGLAGGVRGIAFFMLVLTLQSEKEGGLEKPIVAFQAISLIATSVGMFLGWVPVIISSLTEANIVSVYRDALVLCGVADIVSATALMFKLSGSTTRATRRAEAYVGDLDKVEWNSIAKLVVVGAVISFGAGLSVHIIDFYFTKKFGFDSGRLGTVMSVQNLLMGLGMLAAQSISRELGNPLKTYIVISSMSVPLLVSMTFINSALLSSIIYTTRTLFVNIANPLYQAFELSLVPERYRGRFLALMNVVNVVPAAVGRAVGGWLMTYDLELPLRLTALIYTIAFLLLAIWFPKSAPRSADLRKIGSIVARTLIPFVRLYSKTLGL